MRPSQPAPDYTEMSNMNTDTKYRASTPSDSSRGNVVDHHAANGQLKTLRLLHSSSFLPPVHFSIFYERLIKRSYSYG